MGTNATVTACYRTAHWKDDNDLNTDDMSVASRNSDDLFSFQRSA